MTDNDPAFANDHPGPEQIAAYLSNALPPEERAAMETHLARCRACRRQVTSAQALLRSRPRPMRWAAVAAGAVLAIATAGPWLRSATRTTGSPDLERGRATATTNAIVALTPADGDTIAPATAVFSWRGRGPDILYRLSLTDSRGQGIWTTDTPDTSAVLPPNVQLARGARYFWYVDALGANAASSTTGTRAFVVAP